MNGARLRAEREHNDRAQIAWYVARTDVRMKDLLVGRRPRKKRAPDADAEFNAFEAWATAAKTRH
jgi:hypothetical protein